MISKLEHELLLDMLNLKYAIEKVIEIIQKEQER